MVVTSEALRICTSISFLCLYLLLIRDTKLPPSPCRLRDCLWPR